MKKCKGSEVEDLSTCVPCNTFAKIHNLLLYYFVQIYTHLTRTLYTCILIMGFTMHEKTRPNAGSGIKSCVRVLKLGE